MQGDSKETLRAIGGRIQEHRKNLNRILRSITLTQEGFGRRIGLEVDTIGKLERGEGSRHSAQLAIDELRSLWERHTKPSVHLKEIAELDSLKLQVEAVYRNIRIGSKLIPLPNATTPELIAALDNDKPSSLEQTLSHLRRLIEAEEYEQALVDTWHVWTKDDEIDLNALGAAHSELKSIMRQCRESLSPLAFAQLVRLESRKVIESCGVVSSQRDESEDDNDLTWLAKQKQLAELMIPARGRLRSLKWGGPYASDQWGFIDQPKNGPKQPSHNYWGQHAFLRDNSGREAVRTLYTRQYEYRPTQLRPSHRVQAIAPRMVYRIIQSSNTTHNPLVACTDVAPTRANPTLRISPARFLDYYVGAYSVGIDAYLPDGRIEVNGLSLIAEDNLWLLLRSSHTLKALTIVTLVVSSDGWLITSLQRPDTNFNRSVWTAAAISFAHPKDFGASADGNRLVNAIARSAKRILVRNISSVQTGSSDWDVNVTGAALDAMLGMQPTFFCIAKSKSMDHREISEHLSKSGHVIRTDPLVEDNPAVSFQQLIEYPRHEHAEVLTAALRFAVEWLGFVPRFNSGERAPANLADIGMSPEEVLERLRVSDVNTKSRPVPALVEQINEAPETPLSREPTEG